MPDVKIIGGTNGFPDVLSFASTDQDTILGDGTLSDPLRASGTIESLRALYADPNVPIPVAGSPVSVTNDTDPGDSVTTVVLSTASLLSPGANPFSIGLISSVLDDGIVLVQTTGEITLTTTQWDLITEGSGGLVLGDVYYVSFGFNNFGHLTTVRSGSPGTSVAPVGTALSTTPLLLGIIPVVSRFA
jgi:hypothetical protein